LAVPATSKRLELYERRSLPAASMLDAPPRGCCDREKIVPKSSLGVDPETGGPIRHVLDRHLQVRRRRIGELVYLADDYQRQLVNGRKINALIKIARAGCSISSEAKTDVRLLAHLKSERIARACGYPGGHRAVVVGKDAVFVEIS